jgi:hypothetical protein
MVPNKLWRTRMATATSTASVAVCPRTTTARTWSWRRRPLLGTRRGAWGLSSSNSIVAESPSLARFQGTCLPLDTKSPESELNQWFRRAHPTGELEHSTFYTRDPIMSTNLYYLVHFIQHIVSEIVITIPEVQSAIN